jgi:hypothetical protein
VQTKGVSVKQWKVLRTPVQKETSIVYPFLQKFVNCIEIVEKSEKCKLNFVGFVVKSTTTFVILTWSGY